MQGTSELPDETKEKAIKLFQKIRNAFGEGYNLNPLKAKFGITRN